MEKCQAQAQAQAQAQEKNIKGSVLYLKKYKRKGKANKPRNPKGKGKTNNSQKKGRLTTPKALNSQSAEAQTRLTIVTEYIQIYLKKLSTGWVLFFIFVVILFY